MICVVLPAQSPPSVFLIFCLPLLPTHTFLEPQHLKVWAPLSEFLLAPGLHLVSMEAEVTENTCRSLLSPSSHWWIIWIQPLGQDCAVGISGRAWGPIRSSPCLGTSRTQQCRMWSPSFLCAARAMNGCKLLLCAMNFLV